MPDDERDCDDGEDNANGLGLRREAEELAPEVAAKVEQDRRQNAAPGVVVNPGVEQDRRYDDKEHLGHAGRYGAKGIGIAGQEEEGQMPDPVEQPNHETG